MYMEGTFGSGRDADWGYGTNGSSSTSRPSSGNVYDIVGISLIVSVKPESCSRTPSIKLWCAWYNVTICEQLIFFIISITADGEFLGDTGNG